MELIFGQRRKVLPVLTRVPAMLRLLHAVDLRLVGVLLVLARVPTMLKLLREVDLRAKVVACVASVEHCPGSAQVVA